MPSKLADGQLKSTRTMLYTVGLNERLTSICLDLFNENTSEELVLIAFKDSTSRTFRRVLLGPNESAQVVFERTAFDPNNLIEAQSTTADKVNFWLSGELA